MSGLSRPAAAKMSTTSPGATAFDTSCWIACSMSSSERPPPPAVALRQYRPHRLEERQVVPDRSASSAGTASANACESAVTLSHQPLLAVLLRQDVLLRSRQQRQAAPRAAPVVHALQSNPWNSPQHDLVLLQHHRHGLLWSIAADPLPPLSV